MVLMVLSSGGSLASLIRRRSSRTLGEMVGGRSSFVSTSMTVAAWVLNVSRRRLMAAEPAVETRSLRSAPTKPGVSFAN